MSLTDKIGTVNPAFAEWSDIINMRLEGKSEKDSKDSYSRAEEKLLFACQEHAAKYSKHEVKKHVLGAVHPFFMQLLTEHKNALNDATKKDETTYLENVIDLLTSKSENYSIILFETAHGYAVSTSYLIELGLVDEVIFTKPESGNLVNDQLDALKKYSQSEFYMTGVYAVACILQVKEVVELHTDKKAKLIQNACIYSSPCEDDDNLLSLPEYHKVISKNEFLVKTGDIFIPE